MKKTLLLLILFFGFVTNGISAETKSIISGNENAKITLLLMSH